jgi:hypothetical protein
MTNLIEQMLLTSAASPRFPPNSRYHSVPTAQLSRADGRTITYLRRRFAPQPDALALLQMHRVLEGDRLDNLAAAVLGDPELFWRICDGNAAMQPGELSAVVGRLLRITQPSGVPGESGG